MVKQDIVNVVLVGNGDSIFIIEYLRWIRQHSDYSLILITWSNRRYCEALNTLNVKVILISDKSIGNRWTRAWYGYKKCKNELKQLGKIDILHFHSLSPSILVWSSFIFKYAHKVIMTFWGDDLFNSTYKDEIILKYYLNKADKITLMTKEMENKFHKAYGTIFDDRLIRYIDFGESLYKYIDESEKEMSRIDCKDYWQLPTDRFIVHIGYNKCEAQQHLPIVKELSKLPQSVKDKIFVVMHFGYGDGSKSYIVDIEKEMKDGKIDFTIIDEYLYPKEMAIFRRTADIWIYAQKTDAFSASMCEYMYAGALMLKGAWLRYSELIEGQYYYYDFIDFTKLTDLLQQVLMPDFVLTKKILENRIKLKKLNSWEIYGPKWISVYNKLFCE